MALNIKDPETERLVTEVAQRTGTTKTAAIREVMRQRLDELAGRNTADDQAEQFMRFLREEVWPQTPEEERGRPHMAKAEREELLGYGPEGV